MQEKLGSAGTRRHDWERQGIARYVDEGLIRKVGNEGTPVPPLHLLLQSEHLTHTRSLPISTISMNFLWRSTWEYLWQAAQSTTLLLLKPQRLPLFSITCVSCRIKVKQNKGAG